MGLGCFVGLWFSVSKILYPDKGYTQKLWLAILLVWIGSIDSDRLLILLDFSSSTLSTPFLLWWSACDDILCWYATFMWSQRMRKYLTELEITGKPLGELGLNTRANTEKRWTRQHVAMAQAKCHTDIDLPIILTMIRIISISHCTVKCK